MAVVPDTKHPQLAWWSFGPLTLSRVEPAGIPLPRGADPGELSLIATPRPVTFVWVGPGGSRTLHVPPDELGLPAATVRRAGPRLAASPLHRLVAHHVQDLARDAGTLSATPSADALGRVCVDLVRALLVSAAGEEPALLAQVRTHVRHHLGDPGLSAASIAAALSVSPRQLYRACAAAGVRLEQWIITARLAGARTDLADPRHAQLPIAAVARRWGFKDPTHFTRRFRAAYGVLPSEWRHRQ
ncbi:helix-turn-helix domain-containing protein [Amycolatopsis sp. NPDC049252]|uniref:helix-turn-helix domain-containing protein n=1 Tax=Amycolatopsis sp. NPDC049252 TaxID=3363933 RepID=UPI00371BD003